MSGQPFPDSAIGGITLLTPAIQSPNFLSGSEGWTINQDGSAQFNDLDIRGTFNGADFVINQYGIFIYATP